MPIRPVHTWWLGVALFGPSVLLWIIYLGASFCGGMFDCPFDGHGIRHIYLPMFAALLGLAVPLVCLQRFRSASWRRTGWAFNGYLAMMLAWGIVDIRLENHQIGGHHYPNGPLIDGHRYYWHTYCTWYFIPYRWIERPVPALPDPDPDRESGLAKLPGGDGGGTARDGQRASGKGGARRTCTQRPLPPSQRATNE